MDIEKYLIYEEMYIDAIWFLLEFVKNKNILPVKYSFKLSIVDKNYVMNQKETLVENGIKYLRPNKHKLMDITIQTINMDKVNELYEEFKHIEEFEILVEIVKNSNKLNEKDEKIIRTNFEIIMDLLDKIYKLI